MRQLCYLERLLFGICKVIKEDNFKRAQYDQVKKVYSIILIRLQAEARRHNRSLNNLVESVLMAFVAERPNNVTLAAMKEAETSENLETLDMNSFRDFVNSL